MSGEFCVWISVSDLEFIIKVLQKYIPDENRSVNLYVSEFIPDEIPSQKVYPLGHPKNPLQTDDPPLRIKF